MRAKTKTHNQKPHPLKTTYPQHHQRIQTYRRKNRTKNILAAMLLVVACLASIYPVVSTLWNNHKLAKVATQYNQLENQQKPTENNTPSPAVQDALRYNQQLRVNPITPPPIGQDQTHPDYPKYAKTLDSGNGVMAGLTIPSVGISLPVYHGTEAHTLTQGAGHVYGTQLPVGGEDTTTALAAHTGLVSASMFDRLGDVKDGDRAYLQIPGTTLVYEKIGQKVVQPDDTEAISHKQGTDTLYLITCTPYGVNTERLVAEFRRIPPPVPVPDLTKSTGNAFSWQWWMTIVVGAAAIVSLLAIVWLRRMNAAALREEHAFLIGEFGGRWKWDKRHGWVGYGE